MSHILIVDDEPSICWGLEQLLTSDGHSVSIAASAEEGLDLARQSAPDALVLDIRLPGLDGLSAIEHFRRYIGDIPIILMTAFGNLDVAVRAMHAGVVEYLPKPFDLESASAVLNRCLDVEERPPVDSSTQPQAVPGELLGQSPQMQEVYKQIAIAAGGEVPVLITGESGTGKELAARAIHEHSRRRDAPFLPVCLAGLTSNAMERTLFGQRHDSGEEDTPHGQIGILEMADQGTVLLDEIDHMPLELQVKLLRAIEQKDVQRIGEASAHPTDFRVIAATRKPLAALIESQTFREDLYYQLAVFPIAMPALRERREDIPILAQAFLDRVGNADECPQFTQSALDELMQRDWPGNVRELRNAVEHAALVARGRDLQPEDFPPPRTQSPTAHSSEETLQATVRNWIEEQLMTSPEHLYERFLNGAEPELFRRVLESTNGNKVQAAEKLGIHRATLRQKLKKYELESGE